MEYFPCNRQLIAGENELSTFWFFFCYIKISASHAEWMAFFFFFAFKIYPFLNFIFIIMCFWTMIKCILGKAYSKFTANDNSWYLYKKSCYLFSEWEINLLKNGCQESRSLFSTVFINRLIKPLSVLPYMKMYWNLFVSFKYI